MIFGASAGGVIGRHLGDMSQLDMAERLGAAQTAVAGDTMAMMSAEPKHPDLPPAVPTERVTDRQSCPTGAREPHASAGDFLHPLGVLTGLAAHLDGRPRLPVAGCDRLSVGLRPRDDEPAVGATTGQVATGDDAWHR